MNNISTGLYSSFARITGIVLCTGLLTFTSFAQKASLGQQVAVMKTIKADLKVIGVISNSINDKLTQDLTRAGMSQGITIVIAKAKDAREVSSLYKKLVSERKIQMLWIPDAGDDVVMGIGMDYLKENTVMDGVGLCVPVKTLVAGGALCCVQSEDGKLVAYVNKKIASVVGVSVPAEASGISFVMQ